MELATGPSRSRDDDAAAVADGGGAVALGEHGREGTVTRQRQPNPQEVAPLRRVFVVENRWPEGTTRTAASLEPLENGETATRLIPAYELGCKRPTMSNTYLRAYNQGDTSIQAFDDLDTRLRQFSKLNRATRHGCLTAVAIRIGDKYEHALRVIDDRCNRQYEGAAG